MTPVLLCCHAAISNPNNGAYLAVLTSPRLGRGKLASILKIRTLDVSTSPIPPQEQQALTNQDIQRITEEERLRSRLRSEFDLKPKQESRSSSWAFLNSPFWLVSLIFGGSGRPNWLVCASTVLFPPA